MKTITVHQPEFLPWLGFFDRIYKADIFVILDDVQYQKNGFINRNKIKTIRDWQWITIPVLAREAKKNINEVKINNGTDWGKKLWKTLACNYQKSPYFDKYSGFFESVFFQKWKFIAKLNIRLVEQVMDFLAIKTDIIKSSGMRSGGKGTERLVNICKELKASAYVSGPGGKLYLDVEKFKKENIKVLFQKFKHPEYPQLFPEKGFIPNLSIIDLLFNCGRESIDIIKAKE